MDKPLSNAELLDLLGDLDRVHFDALTEAERRAIREALLRDQGKKCAICGREGMYLRRWCLDHDHETGQIRGVLCGECNLCLGKHWTPEWLREAAVYLERTASA